MISASDHFSGWAGGASCCPLPQPAEACGRRGTISLAVRTWTSSPRWLRVSLRICDNAAVGRERDGVISITSLSTLQDVAGPCRPGPGDLAARADDAAGRAASPPWTSSRMVIAAVCQPLAAQAAEQRRGRAAGRIRPRSA